MLEVSMATGVVLDPVYTGKAVHGLLQDMRENPEEWRGSRVLFVHTGGLLGMYEKVPQLQDLVESLGRSQRLLL
jgi:D-cysteine desulfhydrase